MKLVSLYDSHVRKNHLLKPPIILGLDEIRLDTCPYVWNGFFVVTLYVSGCNISATLLSPKEVYLFIII
jgi:hypothetical protein